MIPDVHHFDLHYTRCLTHQKKTRAFRCFWKTFFLKAYFIFSLKLILDEGLFLDQNKWTRLLKMLRYLLLGPLGGLTGRPPGGFCPWHCSTRKSDSSAATRTGVCNILCQLCAVWANLSEKVGLVIRKNCSYSYAEVALIWKLNDPSEHCVLCYALASTKSLIMLSPRVTLQPASW